MARASLITNSVHRPASISGQFRYTSLPLGSQLARRKYSVKHPRSKPIRRFRLTGTGSHTDRISQACGRSMCGHFPTTVLKFESPTAGDAFLFLRRRGENCSIAPTTRELWRRRTRPIMDCSLLTQSDNGLLRVWQTLVSLPTWIFDSRSNRFIGLTTPPGTTEDMDRHATVILNFCERVRARLVSGTR
jgi:hypothetical protein